MARRSAGSAMKCAEYVCDHAWADAYLRAGGD